MEIRHFGAKAPFPAPASIGHPLAVPRPRLVLFAIVLASSRAAATQVDARCSRIAPEDRPELVARARLTLRAVQSPPAEVRVECDAAHAVVVWVGPPEERLAVDERDGLVEGVLAALERRAAAPPRAASSRDDGEPVSDPVSAVVTPTGGSGAPDVLAPLSPGGLGLAAMAASWSRRAGVGTGGRLDVGVGLGHVVPTASEQLQAGVGGDVAPVCFTTAIGVGAGAPWYADRHFGASALVGVEWLSNAGTRQIAASAVLDLGLRAASARGPFAYWVGADARLRAAPEAFGDPVNIQLPRLSLLVSVGAVLLVDPRRARPSAHRRDGVALPP